MFDFLRSWLKSPSTDDHRHEPKNSSRCFVGAISYYEIFNTPYKHVLVLDTYEEKWVEKCSLVPKLTEWCIENNCIYGWTRTVVLTPIERIGYDAYYKLYSN
jgi:hypothetical protein